jgi:hypothetical protein
MSIRRTVLSCTVLALASAHAFAQAPDQPTPTPPPGEPAPPAEPPTGTPPPAVDSTPVATAPVVAPVPPDAPEKKPEPVIKSKWDATLYGFVEFDAIHDSTQGLGDLEGNSAIPRPHTYTGDHGQTMFGARNSRIGIKLAAPPQGDIKVSGVLEMDFLGNQPGTPLASTALVSEQAFWQNPGFRLRHMNVKVETPVVDFLFGQSWQLFGWQSMFHPNSVQIQGLPGQIYSRSPQARISKTINTGDVAIDVAVAASRPPQRASSSPDGQAGLKLTYNGLKALHTAGSTGTAIDGLAIGASVVGRRIAANNFAATSNKQVVANGYGLSVDALIPVIPATKDKKGNSLTVTGSFVTGAGIADLYQSLNGGVGNPSLPNPGMTTPAPTYTPNFDPAMVQWFADSKDPSGYSLHPIQWTSYMTGLQYYLPPSGKVWLSANFSHIESGNAHAFGAKNKVWDHEDFADGNFFVDVTSAFRFGLEFAYTNQTFVDATKAPDYRGQFSAFLLF